MGRDNDLLSYLRYICDMKDLGYILILLSDGL